LLLNLSNDLILRNKENKKPKGKRYIGKDCCLLPYKILRKGIFSGNLKNTEKEAFFSNFIATQKQT
jgi:hypothetical protein